MGKINFRKWIQPAVVALPSRKNMFVAFILFLVFILIAIPLFNKWMYPLKYEEQIIYSADATGADPFLVMAIIRVESKFDPHVESHAGAQGLMQLTPNTVNWVVDRGRFSPAFRDSVHDPAINIHMGSWYISGLMREFKGNKVAAIAAYNAGPGNVKKWMESGRWDGTKRNLRQVPYGETRHYVQRVLFFHEKYRNLYGHVTKERKSYTLPQ
ncbi:lytic transglycosylase domain-containing protein [Kroppenstedtia pulmonis]|uniref:Lytic transglycosylase domain-containing protein n=1 Tax=Kroppenstedtia pulmonis TaxID=1380685 RepID=A0A7D4CEM6_9BACL|nr:lytic transglycosylase domain-containing protein [Kroppenstedtia pulmonis]QKG83974.1 lytic transglycosylase domain-containing protein [Kroppenstedtia pulmonis]